MTPRLKLWPFGWVRVGRMLRAWDKPAHWYSDIGGVCWWNYRAQRWDSLLFKQVQGKRLWKDI